MNPSFDARLPAAAENAIRRVKDAAVAACERTVECLGLSALSSSSTSKRDGALTAQFELNRKSAVFCRTFNQTLDERLLSELRPRGGTAPESERNWDAMSLVDDHELDVQVTAERFGLEIGHACEWELRELDGFVGPLFAAIGHRRQEHDRNPLRPETVGYAVIRGIEAVSDRSDLRKVLEAEFARSLAATMPQIYAGVIADLRAAGLTPAGMSVRVAERPGHDFGRPGAATGPGRLPRDPDPTATGTPSTNGGQPGPRGFGPTGQGDLSGHGTPMGQVDAELMSLMRRLTRTDRGGEGGASRPMGFSTYDSSGSGFEELTEDGLRLAAPNMIRAHRDELRQAAGGALDHMIIDVVGSLFDQILSDPKVPPQVARQIGRLQLPVLRTALGDPSFFSSRKHPVRRFINRLASLATAMEDLADEAGQQFLTLVRELVQSIVDGDFDHAEVYEAKLAELERFVAHQAREEVSGQTGPAALLAEREVTIRIQQRYAQQLLGGLQHLPGPDFVRDFLCEVWSQVLTKAVRLDGADSPRALRMRHAGRELFLSVQPKGTTTQRKDFLTQLPRLMQELNEGMDLVGWPDSAKKTFFGLLLPAHAQSLKGDGLRTLDFNLLARELDQVFDKPLPTATDLPAATVPAALGDDAILPTFSAEEAQRIGLVAEASVDWNGEVDIDVSAEAPVTEVDIAIAGLPAPEPVEPMQGKSLANHVQIGFAYQMHLDGEWQKVRLNHVSPARTFFVFTRGSRHKQTISLTYRMLVRLCDSSRLRAFESAYLLERATARARRQLAALRPAAVPA